ncbi:DNA topoisomerase 1 [Rhynchospora pubera]|uniref:DNA topoisomerase n=1 Tax=Rhynchospora pubera TaxID=906938 RepID=A0AAV8FL24_9POAL|nr:DNA topoisomerase 1 [Rhynchospora pubera]
MALQLRNLFSSTSIQRSFYGPYRFPSTMVQYQQIRKLLFYSSPYTSLAPIVRSIKPLQHPVINCSALTRADLESTFRFPSQFKAWATYSSGHSGKSKELADKLSTEAPKRKGLFALYNSLNGRAGTALASKSKKTTKENAKADKTVAKKQNEASTDTKTISKEKKASRTSTSQMKKDVEAESTSKIFTKAEKSSTAEKIKSPTTASTTNKRKKEAVPKSSNNSSKTKKSSTSTSPESLVKKSSAKAPSKSKISVNGKNENLAKTSSSKESSSRSSSRTEEYSMAAQSLNGPVKRAKSHKFKPLYPPSGKSVVVVESATKAKVIQKYLGNMYEVVPSYGHVRDLAGRSRSVRPDEDFSMVWEVPHAAWTHLKSIRVALNGAENLILASDPDREGEAIAWHIVEMLHQQDALTEDIAISRVVFHEITESSIKVALQSPRDINMDLVNAYLARRALDYLIGFNISPVLWRKLPGCQSAGRVQSAALALICDRENEIEQFKPAEYWNVKCFFWDKEKGFDAHLTHYGKEKLNQLSVSSEEKAREIERHVSSSKFVVLSKKTSKVSKNPSMPYITSTLQQDSANKLQFSAYYTMKLAQQLYEGVKLSDGEATGLITYMRTDGFHISEAAAKEIVSFVRERYGDEYASLGVRKYSKKVKNAQEAHEAIRPTNIRRLPSTLRGVLSDDAFKLYSLIWARTMACQMDPTRNNMIQVDIGTADKDLVFRSTASGVDFLGYRAVYEDKRIGAIGTNTDEEETRVEHYEVLQGLKVKESIKLREVNLSQHFTKPPPRYSEGALVKKLEELGIGRPSTYAVTMKVLQDRNYVTMENRVLHPEFRGRMVSEFIAQHFSEVSEYSFTADMETELDNVSAGTTQWKSVLNDYWSRFSKCCELACNVNPREVETMLESKFGHILFAQLPDNCRRCPSCGLGTLRLKVSRLGAGYFIGCDQHPKCKYICSTLFQEEDDNEDGEKSENLTFPPKVLGIFPSTDQKVLLKNGPYGFYIQLGEDNKGFTPKRAPVPNKKISLLTLEDAVEMLKYPVLLGDHPDDGQPVVLTLSKAGFHVKHRNTVAPVAKTYDPKEITLVVGLKILKSKDAKHLGRPKNGPRIRDQLDKVLDEQLDSTPANCVIASR